MLHAVGAAEFSAVQARSTVPARKEVSEDDPITHAQPPTVRIKAHAFAQRRDAPGTFVALVDRQRSAPPGRIEVTPPCVQVGTADVGERHAHDRCAWFRIRHRIFFDFERYADAMEDRRSTRRGHAEPE